VQYRHRASLRNLASRKSQYRTRIRQHLLLRLLVTFSRLDKLVSALAFISAREEYRVGQQTLVAALARYSFTVGERPACLKAAPSSLAHPLYIQRLSNQRLLFRNAFPKRFSDSGIREVFLRLPHFNSVPCQTLILASTQQWVFSLVMKAGLNNLILRFCRVMAAAMTRHEELQYGKKPSLGQLTATNSHNKGRWCN
jgi:hypothetical protein